VIVPRKGEILLDNYCFSYAKITVLLP
jgi:hypothetical protein